LPEERTEIEPRSTGAGFALTIGSRGSALALKQTDWVRTQLIRKWPEAQVKVKVIKTSADRDQTTSIRAGSNIGVFVKEIEEALLSREIDLAVHSMKDVPTVIPDLLRIVAIPEREDPRDALITKGAARTIANLPREAVVGTGSIRRQAQLLALRPDFIVVDIRGNVETRLKKLSEGICDAIILACAGLNRLGMQDSITARLEFHEMLPAPGQGALAMEVRKNDHRLADLISFINHQPTALAVFAERAFLRCMGGGCNAPVAVHASLKHGVIEIEGLVASADGSRVVRKSARGDAEGAESLGVALAESILEAGGEEIIKHLRTC
jgi:hydroxymethylbilane synthase